MSRIRAYPLVATFPLALLAVVMIWVFAPVGFVLALVCLAVLPRWGSALLERFLISAVVGLGLIAIVFQQTTVLPITAVTARLALSLVVLLLLAQNLLIDRRGGSISLPRVRAADLLVLLVGVITALWVLKPFLGRSTEQLLSALVLAGWDNNSHYTMFANTYELGSTDWTVNGQQAEYQVYPSLHSTTWSLAQLASQQGTALLTRHELLWSYIMWSGVTVALAMMLLAYVAGDLARRLARGHLRTAAQCTAILLVGVYAILGSPSQLFNYGFTNFLLTAALVIFVSYVSMRNLSSAIRLGWLLVPLGAAAVYQLWTPLLLGLVPAILVLLVLLWQRARRYFVLFLAIAVIAATFIAYSRGLTGGGLLEMAGSYVSIQGAPSSVSPFELGTAIAAPIALLLMLLVLGRSRGRLLLVGLGGPMLGFVCVYLVIVRYADDVTMRLASYYLLKVMNSFYLAFLPLMCAALATVAIMGAAAIVNDRRALSAWRLVAVACATAVIVAGSLGYAGTASETLPGHFSVAPGLQAYKARLDNSQNTILGDSLLQASNVALAGALPERVPVLWDGGGAQQNMWMMSITGVLTSRDISLYSSLPGPPYDQPAVEALAADLTADPLLRTSVLWFREPTPALLQPLVTEKGEYFVNLLNVPIKASGLCPECPE